MSNQPLVTIGIINYNNMQFLEHCVQSFLSQTYQNIEILLIDDCSTDGSVTQLQALEAKFSNIRCIHHKHNSGGPSQGIREIIEQANGKYFQWIASDDFVEPTATEKFVSFLEKTANDYVYSNFRVVNGQNIATSHWNYKVPSLPEMVHHIFTHCSGIIPMNGMYRTDFFRNNKLTWEIYENNDYSSDTINSLYFIQNDLKYGMQPEYLINYRIHTDNGSHDLGKRIRTSLSVYNYIINHFDESLYFPDIDWNQQPNRQQMKNYMIALFFYKKIQAYLQLQGIPQYIKYTISQADIRELVIPYAEAGMTYVQNGLSELSKGPALLKQLQELEKQYQTLLPIP